MKGTQYDIAFFSSVGQGSSLYGDFFTEVFLNSGGSSVVIFCHFSVSFFLLLGSRSLGDPPRTHFGSTAEKGKKKTRFFIVLGSLLGTLGAPLGEPFRSLWPTRGLKNRKNDALQGVCSRARFLIGFSSLFGCLGSIKTRIPYGSGIQNHILDRSRKKHDFRPIL